jgi:hypothetical protein
MSDPLVTTDNSLRNSNSLRIPISLRNSAKEFLSSKNKEVAFPRILSHCGSPSEHWAKGASRKLQPGAVTE